MNVMTVGDAPADVTIKIQSCGEGSAQGFASELDRASSKDNNNTGEVKQALKADKKTQADKSAETPEEKAEDQPEEQKKIHGMHSVPVVICEQNTEAMQASAQNAQEQTMQNAGGIVPENTALETPPQGVAHNAMQAAEPNPQTQYLSQNAMQNPQAQEAVQKADPETVKTQSEPLLQDSSNHVSGNTAAAGQEVLSAQGDAEAFAERALREIADLKKAAANSALQDTGKPVGGALSNMQQTAQTLQTVKTVQSTEQPSGQNGQQTEQNTLAGVAQKEATAQDQATGGETKQNAQDGAAKESGTVQMQTAIGTSGAKVEFQQISAQIPEQTAVRQNVLNTIIDKISTAFGKDTTEMVVQLKPEHLGGLSISLSMGEGGLVAKIVTSEQSVHSMIHGELGMLQEALREKGIPVVHMEVSYGQTSNMANGSHAGNGGFGTQPSYTGNHAAYDNTEEPVNYYYNLSSYDLLTEQGGSVEFSA